MAATTHLSSMGTSRLPSQAPVRIHDRLRSQHDRGQLGPTYCACLCFPMARTQKYDGRAGRLRGLRAHGEVATSHAHRAGHVPLCQSKFTHRDRGPRLVPIDDPHAARPRLAHPTRPASRVAPRREGPKYTCPREAKGHSRSQGPPASARSALPANAEIPSAHKPMLFFKVLKWVCLVSMAQPHSHLDG